MNMTTLHGRGEQTALAEFDSYGCTVNRIDVAELFSRYERAGFLYPAKLRWLAPYLPLVFQNWRRAVGAGELIHWIMTYEDPETGSWASTTAWRCTNAGWFAQHLVGMGGPLASRAVILATNAHVGRGVGQSGSSLQNWFRPSNRFANKVFGSLQETIGPGSSRVHRYSYIAMSPSSIGSADTNVRVTRCDPRDQAELVDFIGSMQSRVLVEAEEIDKDDLDLSAVDDLYRKVGLRSYRRIYIARMLGSDRLIGSAVVHRGPLGFNFSFLENRCELIISPCLIEADRDAVGLALLHAATTAYEDFEPAVVPVVCDAMMDEALIRAGGTFIRQYARSVWLAEGFVGMARHVEGFYERVIRANRAGGLARRQEMVTCLSNA